jgi:hypothetical protein
MEVNAVDLDAILEAGKHIGIIMAELFIGVYFCRQYIEKLNQKLPIGKAVVEQNGINLDIYQHLNYYKELLKADRILLFEFHNGQHYSNYRSALKMSASYEVYRAGLNSIMNQCTNLPIAVMPKLIQDITTKDYTYCSDIEKIKGDMGNSYEFKKSIGIKSFFDVAIRDKDNNVIGFVAVQWNEVMPENVDKKTVEHLAWYLEESVKRMMLNEANIKRHEKHWLFRK